MKNVEQQLAKAQETHSQNSQVSEQHKLRIKNLFARLGAMFGRQKWDSFVGNENQYRLIFAQWVEGLQAFEDYQIERGLTNLDAEGEKWIPSLPEFKKLCLTSRNTFEQNQIAQADAARQAQAALPKPEIDPAIAEAHLNAARDILDRALGGEDVDIEDIRVPCDQATFVGADEELRKHKVRLQMMQEGRYEELKENKW